MDPATLYQLDATALAAALARREVSSVEVVEALIARRQRVDGQLGAFAVRLDAQARAEAQAADQARQRRSAGELGPLHGLPLTIKDNIDVRGTDSTLGLRSRLYQPAESDALVVAELRAAGAIVLGKTNVPQLLLVQESDNAVFGVTRNPFHTGRSPGGSSGGAAVALAQRLLPVADGSDFMGSLRNPAAWAYVFGMRPSQGRVPFWPAADTWVAQLGTEGPMARTVADLAALLSTQAGADPRTPLAIAEGPQQFTVPHGQAALDGLRGLRVGWLGDLQGHLAMEDGLLPVCAQALGRMEAHGALVEPTPLGFSADALWQAWLVWRRALVGPKVAALLAQPGAREHIKTEALWEHRQSTTLGFLDFMAASEVRTAFHQHLLGLFGRFDVLALPATQVWPFPIGQRWPRSIAGRAMDTYHRWMEATIYATFAGAPAISVPAGFDASGRWPMGLQLIGKPQADAQLLQVAAAYEALVPELLARRPAELA